MAWSSLPSTIDLEISSSSWIDMDRSSPSATFRLRRQTKYLNFSAPHFVYPRLASRQREAVYSTSKAVRKSARHSLEPPEVSIAIVLISHYSIVFDRRTVNAETEITSHDGEGGPVVSDEHGMNMAQDPESSRETIMKGRKGHTEISRHFAMNRGYVYLKYF
jgi:hypothetical protein